MTILVEQAHQRERLLGQRGIAADGFVDLLITQAVDALVQDAQQLHIHILRDTDGKIHGAAGQGGGQVVAQVIVQQALGLVGVGVIGINLTRAQGGQAIGKGGVRSGRRCFCWAG